VLAVLAFALFPVAASADSSGYEYENAVPTPTGSHHSTPTVVGGGDDDKANASNTGGGSGGGTGSGSGGGSSNGGGDAGTAAGKGGGENKGGNGSANPQHQNGDGGSSPLVPILIVVALLAAISVGVVYWQKRRGDTPPITPKAG
jgi:cobalamin biosynthesis Mg chelatase CobN